MISHPVYLWHHIHIIYGIINIWIIYDIISTKCDITTLCVGDTTLGICVTSFALQMTSHPLYHTKPQYLWCDIHLRHDISPPVSDIAPTVSFSSQPLHWYHTHYCMTSHLHSVWVHIHYMGVITQCLYLWHHTLYVYDISILYDIIQCYDTTTIV